MKIRQLLIVLTLSISTQAFSQYKGGLEIGGNAMGASEFMIQAQDLETKASFGIRLGYVALYEFNESIFFRGAVLINQRGFSFADERWGLNAIDIPLNMGYNKALNDKGMKWFLDAGINLEYNFRAFTKVNDELVTLTIGSEPGDIKPISTGINVGTGLHFNEKTTLRFNYYRGLTNLLQNADDSWKNYVFGTAFIFFFSKK